MQTEKWLGRPSPRGTFFQILAIVIWSVKGRRYPDPKMLSFRRERNFNSITRFWRWIGSCVCGNSSSKSWDETKSLHLVIVVFEFSFTPILNPSVWNFLRSERSFIKTECCDHFNYLFSVVKSAPVGEWWVEKSVQDDLARTMVRDLSKFFFNKFSMKCLW